MATAKKKAETPQTPSGLALAEAGEPQKNDSRKKTRERAAAYKEAKRKARWG